jgi:hypothetical protein
MAIHPRPRASDVNAKVRDAVNQTGYSLFQNRTVAFRDSKIISREPSIAAAI